MSLKRRGLEPGGCPSGSGTRTSLGEISECGRVHGSPLRESGHLDVPGGSAALRVHSGVLARLPPCSCKTGSGASDLWRRRSDCCREAWPKLRADGCLFRRGAYGSRNHNSAVKASHTRRCSGPLVPARPPWASHVRPEPRTGAHHTCDAVRSTRGLSRNCHTNERAPPGIRTQNLRIKSPLLCR